MGTDSFFKLTSLALILYLAASGICPAATIHVDQSAEGANDGSTWQDAYTSLQDALSAAKNADQILVAQGVYRPDQGKKYKLGNHSACFNLKNGVSILGGFPKDGGEPGDRDVSEYITTLSGDLAADDAEVINAGDLLDDTTRTDNCFHIVRASKVDSTAVIDGFVISGGNARKGHGGGMDLSEASPTIRNCAFTESTGSCGGAMYMSKKSHPTVSNCEFSLNAASCCGGALHIRDSTPVFDNCTFSYNHSDKGGAARCMYSEPFFTTCTFFANRSVWDGGAIHNYGSNPVFHRSRFLANRADGFGGAFHNAGSDPTYTNCLFTGNYAGKDGGAIYGCSHGSDPKLINCTVVGNGAKLFGGGIWNSDKGKVTLTNCILWKNSDRDGQGELSQLKLKYIIASNTCIQGLTDASRGLEIFGDDPLFVQPPDDGGDGWGDNPGTPDVDEGENDNYGDLRLSEFSPCINAGTEEQPLFAGHLDLEGGSRIVGGRIDIGALEFQTNQ